MRWDARIGRRLRLRDLHILMAVVESGSMAKASVSLAVSQPAVSKAISDMEYVLGVRLLERSPRGVQATAYGEALVRRSSAVFNELSQGVKEIEFLADPTAGELRFGSADPFAAAVAAPIMTRLSEQHPRIAFHVVAGDLGMLLHELERRDIELAISRLYPGARLEGMDVDILFHDPYAVAAGAQSPWARRRKIELSELLAERWVLQPEDALQGEHMAAAFRVSGVEPPRPTVTTLSLNLRNRLVATGRFLTILPRFTLELAGEGSPLVALPVDLSKTALPIGMVKLRHRSLSPLAELFVARMREMTRSLAGGPKAQRAPRSLSARASRSM